MFLEIMKRFEFGNTLPLLDPIEEMEIEDSDLTALLGEKEKVDSSLSSSQFKGVS